MNGCRHEILFSSFFLNTPDFSLCLCFNIMEPANPVFCHFVAISRSCGSKLVEQGWNKSKHTQAMSWNHFSGQECSLGGPITPKMSEKELNGAITDHKRPFWGTIAPLDSHSWPVKWFHDIARVLGLFRPRSTPVQSHQTSFWHKNGHFGPFWGPIMAIGHSWPVEWFQWLAPDLPWLVLTLFQTDPPIQSHWNC